MKRALTKRLDELKRKQAEHKQTELEKKLDNRYHLVSVTTFEAPKAVWREVTMKILLAPLPLSSFCRLQGDDMLIRHSRPLFICIQYILLKWQMCKGEFIVRDKLFWYSTGTLHENLSVWGRNCLKWESVERTNPVWLNRVYCITLFSKFESC